jgi:alkanesulfonate monooxygenase SsuD/methylene tetrahydromethanopterin reductase-like flavin-dependent oxidoreductase (luciferase family)
MAADRLGYYSATLYDLLNAPALECWTTLSALAAVTDRIRLTPLVLANTYRPPALLAKMASTLDVISQGRLELGVGAGGGRDDHRLSGLPFPPTAERVEMLEEAVEVIKKLWSEDGAAYQGRYYSLDGGANNPKPVQHPHPPVLIGGHGERHLFRAVAKYADLCNIGFEMSTAEHQERLAVLEQHCAKEGRDFTEIEVTHNTRVVIAESQAEFDRLVIKQAAAANQSPEAYRESVRRAIAGTPEQCAEKIESYLSHGIGYFFLLFPDPIATESLELFARTVMPRFVATA